MGIDKALTPKEGPLYPKEDCFVFFVSESAAAFSEKELGFSLSDSLFLFVFSLPGPL